MPRFSLGCCDRCHGLLFEHPVIFWTRRGAPAPGSISNSSGWQYSASASGPKCFAEIAWRPRSQFWIAVMVTPTVLASWRCVRPRQRRTSASRAPIFASMSFACFQLRAGMCRVPGRQRMGSWFQNRAWRDTPRLKHDETKSLASAGLFSWVCFRGWGPL